MKAIVLILGGIIISLNLFSQSCLPDGIDFTSQAQIDDFQANYPGCNEIEGTVEINGNDITNLNGLNVLTSIGESLYITQNDSLDDLSGLSGLTSLGGSLLISSNSVLTNLGGLENISMVMGDVFISSNPVLNDISALGNINPGDVLDLWITNNVMLSTCDNPFICSYLSDPSGTVNIKNNLPGCNNPPEIAGQCGISLGCLPDGNYNFFSQADIDHFQENYPGCNVLTGVVRINGPDITSLEGLMTVDTIDGSLEVHTNPQLASLSGLDALKLIAGNITIVGNVQLTDISALSNIDTSGINFLGINNNTLLSDCHIASFCDYLFGPFGASHHNIMNNSAGCLNRDEVLLECSVGTKENNIGPAELPFRISPNPASRKITVSTNLTAPRFQISIFNLTGKELARQTFTSPIVTLDIDILPPGMYFIVLEGGKTAAVQKFVKVEN